MNSEEQAVEAARRLGGAVVVKPCDANQGKGVSLNLHGDEEVRQAYRLASCYSSRVMVEEYIVGRHYRLLVVGGKLVAAARRLPAMVTGDGVHTIAELIEIENRNPRRGRGHARPQTRLKVDAVALAVLAKQGKTLEDRPKPGERVLLRENANLSTGGSAWDVTFKVHPFNAALAERAASIIGLDIAGVDLVTPDLKLPLETGKGALIEVNAAPGLRMHLYPSRGRGSNVARAVVDSLFPGGDNGRIPVISVTGTQRQNQHRPAPAAHPGTGIQPGGDDHHGRDLHRPQAHPPGGYHRTRQRPDHPGRSLGAGGGFGDGPGRDYSRRAGLRSQRRGGGDQHKCGSPGPGRPGEH